MSLFGRRLKRGLALIDLRIVCSQLEDYANEIDPSEARRGEDYGRNSQAAHEHNFEMGVRCLGANWITAQRVNFKSGIRRRNDATFPTMNLRHSESCSSILTLRPCEGESLDTLQIVVGLTVADRNRD